MKKGKVVHRKKYCAYIRFLFRRICPMASLSWHQWHCICNLPNFSYYQSA